MYECLDCGYTGVEEMSDKCPNCDAPNDAMRHVEEDDEGNTIRMKPAGVREFGPGHCPIHKSTFKLVKDKQADAVLDNKVIREQAVRVSMWCQKGSIMDKILEMLTMEEVEHLEFLCGVEIQERN